MKKLSKDVWLRIKIITIFFFIIALIATFTYYMASFSIKEQQKREQKCQQVCGENLVVTRCDQKYNIITCDERTRVHHFPK
jgi:hypothetical protein